MSDGDGGVPEKISGGDMITQIKRWWKRQWEVIPPAESDIVGVTFIRKKNDGTLVEFKLEGDEANLWGFIFTNKICRRYRGGSDDPRLRKSMEDLKWSKRQLG